MPLTKTLPESALCSPTLTPGMENEVLSMKAVPVSRICGRTSMTRKIEKTVPRPKLSPMPAMTGSEVRLPIKKPLMARIEPEVMIVGNAKFSVSMIASFLVILAFSS